MCREKRTVGSSDTDDILSSTQKVVTSWLAEATRSPKSDMDALEYLELVISIQNVKSSFRSMTASVTLTSTPGKVTIR